MSLWIAFLLLSSPSSQPPEIHLSPLYGFEPFTTTVTLTLTPDDNNRGLCVVWDGPTSGASCWELNGHYAAPHQAYELKALPAGNYQVWAEVIRPSGHLRSIVIPLQVFDRP